MVTALIDGDRYLLELADGGTRVAGIHVEGELGRRLVVHVETQVTTSWE